MSEGKWLYQIPIDDIETPTPWREIFCQLSHPDKRDTQMAKIDHEYQCMVIAELIRREWNSTFRVHSFRGDFKKWIDAHGDFWHCTFKMIEKVFSVYPNFEHPAVWFAGVLFEREINGLLFAGKTTKIDVLQTLKNQNGKLKISGSGENSDKAENPFEKECTKKLIAQALKLADESDHFRKKTYMPWLRSRMALSTINDEGAQVFIEKEGRLIQSRQGRKK